MVLKPVFEEEKFNQYGGAPEDDEMETSPPVRRGNAIRNHAIDRQRRLLQIMMKLAAVSGYNEDGNLKNKDGTYNKETDIISLLMYALAREKAMRGIDQFVDLLLEARVPPMLITNENLKQKMLRNNRNLSVQSVSNISVNPQRQMRDFGTDPMIERAANEATRQPTLSQQLIDDYNADTEIEEDDDEPQIVKEVPRRYPQRGRSESNTVTPRQGNKRRNEDEIDDIDETPPKLTKWISVTPE